MPDAMTDLLRPAPVPRPLSGPDGVIEGTGVAVASERDAAVLGTLQVTGITHDSGQVRPGDLWAALPGAVTHGARFAAQAAARGATVILTDPGGLELAAGCGLPALVHAEPRSVLGELAARVYGRPVDALTLVGITGTNGKTTLAYLVEGALRAGGHRTGLIGTVGTLVGDDRVATVRTTPEATDLHALLGVMRERGVTAVALEVSSHALVLGRVDGLVFDVAVFTGLSQDHLDFHRDLEDYFHAKASLFTQERARSAVVCVDDEWGERLARACVLPLATYSVDGEADWSAQEVSQRPGGSSIIASGAGGLRLALEVHLPGRYNVANALGALAAAVGAGIPAEVAASGIASCLGVPGRMERIADPRPERALVALVDYAHTPDAVARATEAARSGSTGRLLVVLGAGGDRDIHKRPDMGRIAAERADVVLVTDDNPRSEDPRAIRAALRRGAESAAAAEVIEVPERDRAIATAVSRAVPGDVVLVLGKGHEQGQEIAGRVLPFDDRSVLASALAGADS